LDEKSESSAEGAEYDSQSEPKAPNMTRFALAAGCHIPRLRHSGCKAAEVCLL